MSGSIELSEIERGVLAVLAEAEGDGYLDVEAISWRSGAGKLPAHHAVNVRALLIDLLDRRLVTALADPEGSRCAITDAGRQALGASA